MWDDIWIWLVVAALIIGAVLSFIWPYKPQDESVIQAWEEALQQGVIVVVFEGVSKEKAVDMFKERFPGYEILEVYESPKTGRVWIKARKVGE